MPNAFLVHVRPKPDGEPNDILQVIAENADEAVAAVRSAKGLDAVIRVESLPLSSERGAVVGLLDGKPRLG